MFGIIIRHLSVKYHCNIFASIYSARFVYLVDPIEEPYKEKPIVLTEMCLYSHSISFYLHMCYLFFSIPGISSLDLADCCLLMGKAC